MIFAFYTHNKCELIDNYILKLKNVIDKEPENYLEFAKNPFINSHIIKIDNTYILKLDTIYAGISPFLYVFELIILNKYYLIHKIRKTSRTKEQIYTLNKNQILEILICNQKN